MNSESHYLKEELYQLIQKDRAIFEFFERGSLDGIWYWDLENPENEWLSPRFWSILGYDPKEKKHLSSEWQDLIYPEDLKVAIDNFKKHCDDPNHAYDQIVRYLHKDGSTVWIRCRGLAIRDNTGKPVRMLGAHTDLTSLKKSEVALRESENRYRNLYEQAPLSYQSLDAEGRFIEINQAWTDLMGYQRSEVIGNRFVDFMSSHEAEPFKPRFKEFMATGEAHADVQMLRRGGSEISVHIDGRVGHDESGQFKQTHCILYDISARKQHESEREITLNLLKAVHKENDLKGLIKDITLLMQNWSGCEAVGIRLQENEDYPYFETRGFPPEFVEAERRLCAIDQNGKRVRDSSGNPVLECMCGNVICGRFNPDLPFFTKKGSFWTNSTTDLLASTGEAERQARTRNRCHGEGFESVALIRLGTGNQTLGLLQFNDRRRNRFNERNIELFEGLASSLAIGLSQRIAALSLRESEQHHRSIIQTAMDGFWMIDTQGRLLEVNDAYCRLSGYSKQELLTMRVADLEAGETADDIVSHMETVIAQGENHFESKHRCKDGNIIDVDISVQYLPSQSGRLVVFLRDVTERNRAESVLRESEEKFRNFTEQSFVGFYIIQEGLFKYVNPKFAEIFGYTVDECLDGMHFRQLVYPKDLALVEEQVRRRIAGETEVVQYTFRGVKKTGEIRHVSIYGSSLLFKGKPAVIGTMLDITDEMEFEKRLAHSQRMEAIGALAGGIAHDFNNLLFPIIGLSEILLEDIPSDSLNHENAEEILKAAKRAGDLVNQILSFSRQSENKKTAVRIQQILIEVLKLTRATIPSFIEIVQDIQKDCSLIMADPTHVHQVAMNLITNAFHAVEETGGKISIRLTEIELTGDVSGISLQPGKYALMSVSDTGYGISPENRVKIFEPYFTTKAKGKGTGLGLSVVYGIVKEHGGDIAITSNVGQGTTFDVYFPLMKNVSETMNAETEITPATGTETILLVDDEAPVARLERQMLERLGYNVKGRTSSIEALHAFRANSNDYDLVITDMAMPGMTGDQLARELISIRPTIPVIICTGFSEKINGDKLKAIGIRGLLMKPILKFEMAKMVRKVLDEEPIDTLSVRPGN